MGKNKIPDVNLYCANSIIDIFRYFLCRRIKKRWMLWDAHLYRIVAR